ncbi:MAG: hypothetical protein CMK64_09865 [Pseudoalteromonas sp.]|nr:hypothetical protein [Pseudoalteromonas sp.]|tara:strand:+ start:4317 stop:5564 length:1248 start_codon:yes stop_codon:yes gene_type:complete
MSQIILKKDAGPIVFLGSMNAMPMMYAIELKKLGYPVLYFVDAHFDDHLNRPESHFQDISYPYPSWIKELQLSSQLFLPFAKAGFSKFIEQKVRNFSDETPQLYVLNGFFISLAPSLKNKAHNVIALSHGSDLDSWADKSEDNQLIDSFSGMSFFKFLPKTISSKLIRHVVSTQYNGLENSDKVIYFPKKFNDRGDIVINELIKSGVKYHERYDISFEPLIKEDRTFKQREGKLVVFSGVRFLFETFTEGNQMYSKGNDIIIKGIAEFYKQYKDIEVHFVEKGPDVQKAKELCKELGIESLIQWHSEMKFSELLKLYRKADICFDQVGKHWIAAIGGYALWLGKPLIANAELSIKSGVWPSDTPVLDAKTPEQISESLHALLDDEYRKTISEESKVFAERYFSPNKLLEEIFSFQ